MAGNKGGGKGGGKGDEYALCERCHGVMVPSHLRFCDDCEWELAGSNIGWNLLIEDQEDGYRA